MHSETQFSTQVHLPAPLYIHLYSERAFRLVHRSFSRLSIYHARFCFLIHHSDPFSTSAEARDPPAPPQDSVTLTGVTCDTEWPGGVRQVVNLFWPWQSFFRLQWSDIGFVGFIFISKHQIITWSGVISPVLALDKCFHLISNMASWWLYQTIHSPALFFLSVRPFHISLSLFLFSLPLLDPHV